METCFACASFASTECLNHPTLAKTQTRVDCVWIRDAFPDCFFCHVCGLWRVAVWSLRLSQQLWGPVNCVVRVSKPLVSCRWVKSPEKPVAGFVCPCRGAESLIWTWIEDDWSMFNLHNSISLLFKHHTLIQVLQKYMLLILVWLLVWYGYLLWTECQSRYQSLPEWGLEIQWNSWSLNHLKICNNIFHTTIPCAWYTVMHNTLQDSVCSLWIYDMISWYDTIRYDMIWYDITE